MLGGRSSDSHDRQNDLPPGEEWGKATASILFQNIRAPENTRKETLNEPQLSLGDLSSGDGGDGGGDVNILHHSRITRKEAVDISAYKRVGAV
ncbi:hypothetical protein E2C01_063640 [Portunus trituberculatus]|uniref:Uncharacterized protein n=1 Tax=Portunus trituberculatus TaxID=210409 RepID=A0A5B7HHL4_PORTR|nr:hypothetical protein [Portunus trituberculatus]